ncbi:hypothetical protein GGR53DRAFT_198500 [Hypoxylon sp. FL1150]|nr:hypothetical protein GGR53DRAFT_198500 [Hypoxylon sp. FL1150]
MDYGEGHRGPRQAHWLWRSALMCFMAVLATAITPSSEVEGTINPHSNIAVLSDFDNSTYPYWYGCQSILLDTEPFENWFDEAEANTAVITTMLEALPLSSQGTRSFASEAQRITTEIEARQRNESLAKAREEFDGFLALRKRVMRSVFTNRNLWHYYADDKKEINEIRRATGPEIKGKKGPVRDDKYWADAAERAARIATNVVQTHYEIWNHGGAGAAMAKHLAAAAKHTRHAGDLEGHATRTLSRLSAKAKLWDSGHLTSPLLDVEKKLVWAQRSTEELLKALQWTQENVHVFPGSINIPETRAKEWATRMQRLVGNWEILLQVSHRGMLFLLRRNELKAAGKHGLAAVDFEQLWEDWKTRNCGGTSCYDEDGFFHRTLQQAGVIVHRPLASRAKDEEKWCYQQSIKTKPFVWRAVYEEACCQDTELVEFLKYGPIAATYKPRLVDEL